MGRIAAHIALAIAVTLTLVAGPVEVLAKGSKKQTYFVRPGDTLGEIAKEFKVKVSAIRSWNGLDKKSWLKAGQKLTLYTSVPIGTPYVVKHKIKKGDTLSKIAKKYGLTIKQVRRQNKLKKKSMLIAGRVLTLHIYKKGKKEIELPDGVKMPPTPGYFIKNPEESWGKPFVIKELEAGIAHLKKTFPDAPDLVLGDLSLEGGGYFPPHLSHRTGWDVDLGYYAKGGQSLDYMKTMSWKAVDWEKMWCLLDYWIQKKVVKIIFMDYPLQKGLYNYLKKKGYSKKQLAKLLQYPKGRKVKYGLIRHLKGHASHVHVRFKLP